MWLGTRRGLNRFEHGKVSSFRLEELAENNVAALTSDAEGHVWLGVGSMLVQIAREEFDRKTANPSYEMKSRQFGKTDGLPGIPVRVCCRNAARGTDGRLWFLTTGGVALVDPRHLQKEPSTPPIILESVVADGRPMIASADLRLAPLTSNIEINYTALSLAAASKARFRYKLEGFDRGWVEAGGRRQASYTNLDPGTYRFRVTIHSTENGWEETGMPWSFTVLPTFYQTRWFLVGCVLLSLAAIGGAWHLRLRHVRRQFSLVVNERTRVARELHDTLLQGLVGVALQFDGISQQMNVEPRVAQDRLGRVRRQVEQFIRETRKAIWDLRSETLEASDLPTALRDNGNMLTEGLGVNFNVVVEGAPRRTAAVVEEQILRISGEAISNAVRHAQATEVNASLSYLDDAIRLEVLDNGCGFNVDEIQQKPHRGLGLSSMRDRARKIQGRLTLVSASGNGTRVELLVHDHHG